MADGRAIPSSTTGDQQPAGPQNFAAVVAVRERRAVDDSDDDLAQEEAEDRPTDSSEVIPSSNEALGDADLIAAAAAARRDPHTESQEELQEPELDNLFKLSQNVFFKGAA